MGQYGGGKASSPAWALVRPVLMLVVGLVAGLLMWQVLMADPGGALR
jgi:hypothetical protein